MRRANIVATCMLGLLPACSVGDDCRDGRVTWRTEVASYVPLRPDAFGPDWALRLDSRGDSLAVSGQFTSDIALAGVTVASTPAFIQSFVAAYDLDGTARWSNVIAGAGTTPVRDVAAGDDGHAIAIGTFGPSMTLGGSVLCATSRDVDVFVVNIDPAGTVAWTRCLGSAAADHGVAVAVTAEGDVIIAGEHGDTIDLGTATLAGEGAFVARLAGADGSILWAVELRTDEGLHPTALAIDAGDVIVAGHDDRGDLFATARSGSDGRAMWAREVVTPGDDLLVDVAVDAHGRVVLAGRAVTRPTAETVQIDAGLLVVLDDAGTTTSWSRTDPMLDPEAIAMAPSGVWVTGVFVGARTCADGSSIAASGSEGDAFIARFDADSGALASLARYGGPLSDGGLGIVADGDAWIAAAYIDDSAEPRIDAFGDLFPNAGVLLFAGQ